MVARGAARCSGARSVLGEVLLVLVLGCVVGEVLLVQALGCVVGEVLLVVPELGGVVAEVLLVQALGGVSGEVPLAWRRRRYLRHHRLR